MNKKLFLITGDTHGDLNLIRLKKAEELNPEYLIVTGDFGYIFDGGEDEEKALNEMEKFNFNILFVDGNHENFDLLNKYPITEWNGGLVQKIRNNVIRLRRGEIYTIEGKTFFTFGGAKSIDIYNRFKGINYWEEESPTSEEMQYGIENLKKVNNNVDYIITHTCASSTLKEIMKYFFDDDLSTYFEFLKHNYNIKFKTWYFGHLHYDIKINEKEVCLYKNILELK
ncbi:metallophosphoesterase family protein [Clostridium perfringens]